MGLIDGILDPILGLIKLVFPNNRMNDAVGTQVYKIVRLNPMTVEQNKNSAAQAYDKLVARTNIALNQSSVAEQLYKLIQQVTLAPVGPMNANTAQNNYNVTVNIVYIPDPDKTTVYAGGNDAVYFTNLPVPSHWVTQQHGFLGAHNEFDFEESFFEATFNPPGLYTITISAPGFATQSWVINAIEDTRPPVEDPPPPPPEEEPEEPPVDEEPGDEEPVEG